MKFFVSIILAIFLVSCTSAVFDERLVSENEALIFFNDSVQKSLKRDFINFCKGAANEQWCIDEVKIAGNVMPQNPPIIMCTIQVPNRKDQNGTISIGGVILIVKGINDIGKQFTTDVLVFRHNGKIMAHNIIWWSGTGISLSGSSDERPKCQ